MATQSAAFWKSPTMEDYTARVMRAYAKKIDDELRDALFSNQETTVSFSNFLIRQPSITYAPSETAPAMTKQDFSAHLTTLIADAAGANLAKSNLEGAQRGIVAERKIAIQAAAARDSAIEQRNSARIEREWGAKEIERLRAVVGVLHCTIERLETSVARQGELLRRAATPTYYSPMPHWAR